MKTTVIIIGIVLLAAILRLVSRRTGEKRNQLEAIFRNEILRRARRGKTDDESGN